MATLIQFLQHELSSRDPLLPNDIKRVILKGALQSIVLDFIYNHPKYRRLNFYGGSCLHVIYGLNRLSEDIDFDNGGKLDLGNLDADLLAYVQSVMEVRDATVKRQLSRQGILRITLKFPVLKELGLSPIVRESLHLKVEITHHPQVMQLRNTPVMFYGRSFVPSHFSLETMMAGKILACLERSFQKGRSATMIKGRDWYDMVWFMQKEVIPLEEKLLKEGDDGLTIKSAMHALDERARIITKRDLALDLLPLFEQRVFIEAWIDSFQENFLRLIQNYL